MQKTTKNKAREQKQKLVLANAALIASLGIGAFLPGNPALAATDKEPLSQEQLCQRLMLTEEILIFDSTGTKIKGVYREGRGNPSTPSPFDKSTHPDKLCRTGGTSNYTSNSLSLPVIFNYQWTVNADGTMHVSFEQGTDKNNSNSEQPIKGSLGKRNVDIKDFSPFIWVSPIHKAERVVIRLTPSLTVDHDVRTLTDFPVVLDDATVFDGKGKLWTANLNAKGIYLGVTTVQGSFMISFQEFPGAKKAGIASDRELRFKTEDGTSVVIKTASPILPGNMTASVYVLVDTTRKAESISSQHVSSGSKPDETLKRFNSQKAK